MCWWPDWYVLHETPAWFLKAATSWPLTSDVTLCLLMLGWRNNLWGEMLRNDDKRVVFTEPWPIYVSGQQLWLRSRRGVRCRRADGQTGWKETPFSARSSSQMRLLFSDEDWHTSAKAVVCHTHTPRCMCVCVCHCPSPPYGRSDLWSVTS